MDPVALSYLKHQAFIGHFVNSDCKAFCLKKELANEVKFVPKRVCILCHSFFKVHCVISSSGLLKDACCSSCCFNCLRFTSFTAKRSIRSSGVSPILSFTGFCRSPWNHGIHGISTCQNLRIQVSARLCRQ